MWRNAYADIGISTDSEFAVIDDSVSVQIFDVTVVLRDDRDLSTKIWIISLKPVYAVKNTIQCLRHAHRTMMFL